MKVTLLTSVRPDKRVYSLALDGIARLFNSFSPPTVCPVSITMLEGM